MTNIAELPVENQEVDEKQPQTQGAIIDALFNLREDKKALEAQVNRIKEDMTALEFQLIDLLDEQETDMGRGKLAGAVLTETNVPKVDDWEAFDNFVLENEATHLYQRRIASTAIREMMAAGEAVPGITTFLKRAISLRKKS